jgi:hypothetical protein
VKYSYSFHVVIANLGQAVRTEYTWVVYVSSNTQIQTVSQSKFGN